MLDTKLRPLEIMADVVANFLTKMSERLKVVTELEMLNVDHGFPVNYYKYFINIGEFGW